MSEEFHPYRTFMMLFIGRPVLNAQWHRYFFSRDITFQEDLRYEHFQVHTYPVAPFFDAPAARQLLSTIDYTTLYLFVNFLELNHQQCATILDGLTALLDNLPEQVDIRFRLEYEIYNVEHYDAVQQAEAIVTRRRGYYFDYFPNYHIEAFSRMAVNGDVGHGRLDHPVGRRPDDDSPPLAEDN